MKPCAGLDGILELASTPRGKGTGRHFALNQSSLSTKKIGALQKIEVALCASVG
jgi:hypothetical protein